MQMNTLLKSIYWPAAVAQGLWLSRTITRLPEAEGPPHGIAGSGDPVELAIYGESPVAGVGVNTHQEGLGPAVAGQLARRLACSVRWRVVGRNGLKSGELSDLVKEDLDTNPAPEYALVCMGVNDAKGLTHPDRWVNNLMAVRRQLNTAVLQRLLYSGVPRLGQFPALPRPLSLLLADRALRLEQALKTNLTDVERLLAFTLDFEPDLFASDGFHPSADGFQLWGKALADGLIDL